MHVFVCLPKDSNYIAQGIIVHGRDIYIAIYAVALAIILLLFLLLCAGFLIQCCQSVGFIQIVHFVSLV